MVVAEQCSDKRLHAMQVSRGARAATVILHRGNSASEIDRSDLFGCGSVAVSKL